MSFDPVDYYHFASWLFKQNPPHEEARTRAVIAKAYYGAFLAARNKAKIQNNSSAVHEAVQKHYAQKNAKLANRLDDLRKRRNEADYDTNSVVTSKQSGESLKLAAAILRELGVILEQASTIPAPEKGDA